MNHLHPAKHKHVVLPTAYYPPISYLFLMLYHKSVYIDVHETYQKQTWRNRCRILTANGTLDLTIPVKKPVIKSSNILTIETSDHLAWRRNHWRSISSAYSKAPFFMYYADLIQAHYRSEEPGTLIEWNEKLLKDIIHEIDLDCHIYHSSFFIRYPDTEIDFRKSLSPKWSWVNFDWPVYHQVFDDRLGFTPDLSILDLLFNMGPDTLHYLKLCARQYDSQFNQDKQP